MKRKPSAGVPVEDAPVKLKRCILRIMSDTHVGSLVGVCPPKMMLEGGGEYTPNRVQREELNPALDDFFGRGDELSGKYGYPIVDVFNGDLTEGTRKTQIALATDAQQINSAYELLYPKMKRSACRVFIRGTAFHVGELGAAEESVARRMDAVRSKITGDYSHFRIILRFGNLRFDFMHHVSTNSVPWTRGTGIRSEVLKTIYDCAESQIPIPNVVVRSHAHRFQDTGDTFVTRGFVTPAFQAITEYGHKVPRPYLADVGGLLFIIEDDHYTPITTFRRKVNRPEEFEV